MQTLDRLPRIRVLIADDNSILREGVQEFINLQPDMCVCGQSETVSDALAQVGRLRPDVMTVDFNLGGESGFELIRQLRATGSTMRILVLSSLDDPVYVRAALTAGADGYVSKQAPARALIETIRELNNTAKEEAAQ